jgi:alpha-1,2-mannosyltransferase
MVIPFLLGIGVLCLNAHGHAFGMDFRGGMWTAGKAILAGRSPNPPANVHVLDHNRYAFIPPPPLAVLAVPFAVLPFTLAIVLWDVLSLAALLGALYLVGVRDWRLALAACSFPFISTLGFGQTEGILALGLAAAWRWRDSLPGAVAVGALIAAKLLVWPLLIWLLVTRRFRIAAAAVGFAIALLVVSWGTIGFKGLLAYPSLLIADARSAEDRTHSITSLLMRIGVSGSLAQTLALAIAAIIAAVIVSRSRRSDLGYYVAAIAFSLLASTLLEMHYLTLLLIPLAIARPRLDLLWLFAINVFWLSPHDPAGALWQIALVLASTTIILISSREGPPQTARPDRRHPSTRRVAARLSTSS